MYPDKTVLIARGMGFTVLVGILAMYLALATVIG